MKYIAYVYKEDESYVAAVPDLNYTSSFGDTFEEAVDNIIEAAELYCEDLKTLPKASSFEELSKTADKEPNSIAQIIDVKVEKIKRINIMFPTDLLEAVDAKAAKTNNGNRSAYLQEIARQDLAAI